MNTSKQHLANALLRISLGIMFIAHGLLKVLVFGLDGTVGFFGSLGLPAFLAYAVTFGEIIGGALIVLGLFVRPVTAALIPVLLGALWVHWGNGWVFSSENGGWEYPAFLVIASVVLFLSDRDPWQLGKS
ncbi:MAG: DoxX family protein [Xanthomonadales bacterium]|nr:DoxX family protein [Xanthomonadales bacterium]